MGAGFNDLTRSVRRSCRRRLDRAFPPGL